MSTPTKSAPPVTAPSPVKASAPVTSDTVRKTRTSLPAVDFADVAVADGGDIVQSRKSRLDGTPVRGWVADSRTNGNKVKTVSVPTGSVETIKSMLMQASSEAGHGIKFGQALARTDKPGFSTLSFQTKDKKPLDTSPDAVAARAAKRAAAKTAK